MNIVRNSVNIWVSDKGELRRADMRYAVYVRHANYKKANISRRFDDMESAKGNADFQKARQQEKGLWGVAYKWIRVKDMQTGKYIYEA